VTQEAKQDTIKADSRGRLTVGEPDELFERVRHPDGTIVLTPERAFTREAWIKARAVDGCDRCDCPLPKHIGPNGACVNVIDDEPCLCPGFRGAS
jgi:hypothetical protein